MTVLLTHERFLPDFGGGGEEIVFQTARHLQAKGAQVRVLTTGDPRVAEYGGVRTIRLPISRYRLNLAASAIRRLAHGIDIIHTFNYHACFPSWIAGRRNRTPVICTVLGHFRDAWREMRGPVMGRCFAAWEQCLMRLPYDRTVFLSDYSRSAALEAGVSRRRALVNCPGIDPIFFATTPRKDGSVLFAGKFEARKGVEDVLAVARALPDVQFRLAGWGPGEEALRRDAPPNVEILGLLQPAELAGAYSKASVFLFPSRAETLGLVLAEAMASRCAVVSTVDLRYEGVVVHPGDVASMTRAVRDLLQDPERIAALGRRNAELARYYTWERYADELIATYSAVAREARR